MYKANRHELKLGVVRKCQQNYVCFSKTQLGKEICSGHLGDFVFCAKYFFFKIKFKYLEHDLWRHEGFFAHDNHVSVRKANAGLRIGRVFRVQAVAWRHCAVLLLRNS